MTLHERTLSTSARMRIGKMFDKLTYKICDENLEVR